jgi:hypothetical protein
MTLTRYSRDSMQIQEGTLDGARDLPNMPLAAEPKRVRDDLAHVSARRPKGSAALGQAEGEALHSIRERNPS